VASSTRLESLVFVTSSLAPNEYPLEIVAEILSPSLKVGAFHPYPFYFFISVSLFCVDRYRTQTKLNKLSIKILLLRSF
jgi:hypothetical protein